MTRFEYDGPVYVRPIGRGIVLKRLDTQLDDEIDRLVPDAMSGWEGEMRIEIEFVRAPQPSLRRNAG